MPALKRSQQFAIVGFAFGAFALYRGMPRQMPPRIAIAGSTIWLGAPMAAFLLPTAVLFIDALLRTLYDSRPMDDTNPAEDLSVCDSIVDHVAGFVTATHVFVLLALIGALRPRTWIAEVVPVMLGITLVLIGNLLPKTRPNLAIGIRTRETLCDRALWIRTHRSAGYLLVGLGAVIVLSALAVPRPVGPGMILVVGPLGIAGGWLVTRRARG